MSEFDVYLREIADILGLDAKINIDWRDLVAAVRQRVNEHKAAIRALSDLALFREKQK